MKTKKDRNYSFNHFKERLKERYDIDITLDEYDKFCNIIIHGKKFLINTEKQKNDIQEIYDVPIGGILIRVVWSKEKQLLTTALPKPKEHHIWCNYYILPVEKCKSCKRLNKLYPMDGLTPDELMENHFPDAIKVIKGE